MRKSVYALLAALTLLGCSKATKDGPDGDQPVKVSGVSLLQSSLSLFVGKEATLTVIISPKDAENTGVTWSSSNSAIASVDKGLVKALKAGETVITVKTDDGGYTATCTVTVKEEVVVIPVTGISLDKTVLELTVDDQVTLSATVSPANATNKQVRWSTSNASVAGVDQGKVTAVAPGEAVITVTTEDGGFTANCTVTVKDKVHPVTSVSLDKNELALFLGGKATLVATILPNDATDPSVTWSSDNSAVANVADGEITAVGVGTAMVTVTTVDGGFTASCSVTVNAASNVIAYTTSDGQPAYVNLPESIGTLVSNTYVGGRGLLVFEEGVTTIGERAFQASSTLTSIELPSSVTTIGDGAFMGCSSLSSIAIPASVTSVGAAAFAGCTSLSQFSGALASAGGRSLIDEGKLIAVAPAGLTEFTVPSGVTALGKSVFSSCSELTKIILPEGLVEIGDGAFKDCTKLASITIPSGVERIPTSAFEGCSSLSEVNLPATVSVIGQYAFYSCHSLQDVILPEGIQNLDDYCFGSCNVLTTIDLPSTVTRVGNAVFSSCRSLSSVTVRAVEPPQLGGSVFTGVPTFCSFFVPAASLDKYKNSAWNNYNGRIYSISE